MISPLYSTWLAREYSRRFIYTENFKCGPCTTSRKASGTEYIEKGLGFSLHKLCEMEPLRGTYRGPVGHGIT